MPVKLKGCLDECQAKVGFGVCQVKGKLLKGGYNGKL